MRGPTRSWLGRAAEILVLVNFAVAQPLYDVLARNATFFAVRRSKPVDLLLLVALLSFALPAVLIALEALAGRIARALADRLHGVLVTVLGGLLALGALSRLEAVPGLLALPIAVLAGFGLAVGLARLEPLRQVAVVLVPAPLVFAGLFLLGSQVRQAVFERADPLAALPKVAAETPVVLVVFDEFNGAWLRDEQGRIDAARYPNLAALAADGTWFRNATTVSGFTDQAVPAILTGRAPDPSSKPLPTYASYPNNLFTLLGGSYEMEVVESITSLCPEALCERKDEARFARRVRQLLLDLSVVYLHVVLTPELADGLPAVTASWQDFIGADSADQEQVVTPVSRFSIWVARISRGERPRLFFAHVLFPHAPWRYLPSGRTYEGVGDAGYIEGEDERTGRWTEDEWPVIQAFQRYLLQVGMADRMVGELVARLKAEGLYDDALVVVTADHGISFRPGQPRRGLAEATLPDIMPVPLIVKAPGQRAGVISERNVQSIDILPTIADLLDVEIPWPVEGRSAVDDRVPEPDEKFIVQAGGGRRFVLGRTLPLASSVARMHSLFGTGDDPERLYRIGRYRDLIGRPVGEGVDSEVSHLDVELDWAGLYEAVDPDGPQIPTNVKGRLLASRRVDGPIELAVAVNGVVRAVTRTAPWRRGSARFSAMVPETAFRPGSNEIDVYVVSGPPSAPRLAATRGRGPRTYRLEADGGREVIVRSDGVRFPVTPGLVQGSVDRVQTKDDGVAMAGWAVDVHDGQRPARSVLIFIDGHFELATGTGRTRRSIAARYGNRNLEDAGFSAHIPSSRLADGRRERVRVFAISDAGAATELPVVGSRAGAMTPAAQASKASDDVRGPQGVRESITRIDRTAVFRRGDD